MVFTRIAVYGIAILIIAASFTTPAAADTKLFLLGGQSNMAGVGGYETDDPLPAEYNVSPPNVKFWDYGTPQPVTGKYGTFVYPWVGDHWVDLQGGFGHSSSYFGPEVSFGHRLHELFPNDDVYLVKEGISSADLAVDWNPNGTGWVYNRFKERVNAALANLRAAGLDPEIAGMIWMQGESDALNSSYAQSYAANLENFIGKVRSDFDAPEMPFVMGRILPYYDTAPAGGNATVRLVQETIQNQPGIGKVTWIDTDDLQLAYGGHYGTQGQLDLGVRFADEFAPVPEPAVATLLGIGFCIFVIAIFIDVRKSSEPVGQRFFRKS